MSQDDSFLRDLVTRYRGDADYEFLAGLAIRQMSPGDDLYFRNLHATTPLPLQELYSYPRLMQNAVLIQAVALRKIRDPEYVKALISQASTESCGASAVPACVYLHDPVASAWLYQTDPDFVEMLARESTNPVIKGGAQNTSTGEEYYWYIDLP